MPLKTYSGVISSKKPWSRPCLSLRLRGTAGLTLFWAGAVLCNTRSVFLLTTCVVVGFLRGGSASSPFLLSSTCVVYPEYLAHSECSVDVHQVNVGDLDTGWGSRKSSNLDRREGT